MEEDMAYEYFKAALSEWFSIDGNSQKKLEIDSGIGKSYLSQLVGGGKYKTKTVNFDCQVKIAKGCGYDYLSFLQRGKAIIERNITPLKKVQRDHQNMVLLFKDIERGYRANEALLKIEKYNRDEFINTVCDLEKRAEIEEEHSIEKSQGNIAPSDTSPTLGDGTSGK